MSRYFQECGSSFFKIKVLSEIIKFEDDILSNISDGEEFPKVISENGSLYSLSEGKGTIRYWYNNNLYKIMLNKKSDGIVRVKFKGKDVEKTKIRAWNYIGFIVEVDIYGMSTKEALSLNREELSREASNQVCRDIYDIIQSYFDLLKADIGSIKSNTDLVDSFIYAYSVEI